MTALRPHSHVRLLVGLESAERSLLDQLTGRLALEFGSLHLTSPLWLEKSPAPPRGDLLARQWLVFNEPLNPINLAPVKCHALRLEQLHADPLGQPRIRLDVAWLDPSRVLHAAAADAPHRVYLGAGVYGEVILLARPDGSFAPLPWTRPRDAAPAALEFMARVREDWAASLTRGPHPPGRELPHG